MKAIKKLLSLGLIIALLSNYFFIPKLNAVDVNWAANPWTIEKAEHLARRALIWPNPDIIKSLYDAWSSGAAVNILFPSVSGPDRTAYETELEQFKQTNFSSTDWTKMTKYYQFVYYKDPYEAKRKFFWLFEDIFSVDKTSEILYTDVENHFDNLYSETLWNYKTMVKKVLLNTEKPESSYADGQYLNLLNQPDKNSPNENYARELMQLFLMLEYKPWEDAETPLSVRNYSEADVAALAKILTWFRAWVDKKVYFDNNYHNTSTWITFLDWELKSWDSFSFYNTASWTIDNTQIVNPINWNNWLADNIIDYIFSKRWNEIADFVAYRMLKYYVSDAPTKEEIENVASVLIQNNFDLYPTVKYLLASDMMYSDKSINSIRYKTPIELTIWTLKLLHYKDPSINDVLLSDTSLLSNLDWAVYTPRSIFGRAWFDNNLNFMNAYFHNQWVTYASKIAFTTWSWAYNLTDIIPETRKTDTWGLLQVKTSTWNTYSWSIKLTDINLTLAQQIVVWTQSEITTLEVSSDSENILLEKTSSGEILENTWALTEENTSSWETDSSDSSWSSWTLMWENTSSWEANSSNTSENTWNITETTPSLDIPVETPQTENARVERATPEITIPESMTEIPALEIPKVETPIIETPAPEMPVWEQTSFLNFFFPKASAADILSNNISFSSWSLTIPTFSLTLSGWSISFTWSLDMSSKVLNMTSWKLTYSWSTYDITSGNAKITDDSTLDRDITIDEMIKQMEDYLYFGRRLPTSVKDNIKTFLLTTDTWSWRTFLPNDTNYRNKYIKWVFAMMLSQPEFLLQSWYDKTETTNSSSSSSPISWDSKLIMIELYGWYDWLHAMVPKNEYSNYLNVRSWMNFSTDELIDVWDYYLNKSYEAYKQFYDSWELRIVNRVWAPNHSRWHDTAAIQVTSQKALQTVWTPWIIWELIKNEQDPLKNIVLWTNRPTVYTNWKYINIWWASAVYKNNIWWTTTNEKNYQISTLKSILNSRTYPWDLSQTFKNSITLDNVATQSKASWWQEWSWYNLSQKLTFTKTLIDNNLWVTYYVPWGWWYDTHWDQQKTWTWIYNLTDRTRDLSNDIATFFNQMKAENKDVTIVVFSEFWRTLKTNWTIWTDHWQWGWYFILTTNSKLKQAIPDKVVWDLSVTKEYNDWFWVWIDYRAVYSKILTSLYNLDASNYFFGDYNLDDYLNTTTPNPVLFRWEYKNTYWNNVITDFKFSVDDKNFIFKDWSYIKFFYWKDPNNLSEYSRWTLSNTALQADWSFNLSLNLTKLQKYYYKVQVVDNQYDEYILNWSFTIPDKITNNAINQVSLSNDTYFTKYSSTQVNWIKDIEKLVLFNNPVELIANQTDTWSTSTWSTSTWVTYTQSWSVKTISFTWTTITMTFGTWETSISQITSSTWKTWNWGFLIPTEINKTEFLSEKSLYDSKKISNYYVDKLLKVWADTLWVWMVLNQDVIIWTPLTDTSKDYVVLTSEDWQSWANLWTWSLASWKLYFKTNHFSYFALVDSQILSSTNTWSTWTWTQNPDTWTWSNSWTWWTNNWNTWTGKLLSPISKNKTEMAFSGKTIEEAFSMIWENIWNAYSFTWWQVLDVLTWAIDDNAWIIQNITFDETTNFYTSSWSLNFKKQVLSNETSTSGNTRYNFSWVLRLWWDETIVLDKVATIKFTSSSASKIAYRKNSSSNWNILSIQNWDCTPSFPSLCAYRSWNNVFIKTYHFTDFSLVWEENISSNNNSNTSSSNWSWRGLVMDKCPLWDLSPSYYDRTCEVSKMNSTKVIKKVDNKNISSVKQTTSTWYKITSEKFWKYTITKIEWYKSSSAINDLAKYVAWSRKIMPKDKDMIIKRLNDYLLARYELETWKDKSKIVKNRYQKQFILLKSALKKVN